ncbi:MAG: lipoate--protein ligase [Clostridiales bacterium]|jgi:lipoate-protein ligase A|nr:lipoate--protein ligase [Clostridiales bacterium]
MIYLTYDSENPSFWFGLEREILQNGFPGNADGGVFLFWRTAPTLMLGRYQNAASEIHREYARQHGIRIVRRLTGGGTIYTDPGSWQFSFIREERENRIDFREFIQPVADGLRRMGLAVEMNARNDLLTDGRKFCGNAQHHGGGRVLHHGSILFDTDIEEMTRCLTVDSEKIISKGIRSVRQRVVNLKTRFGEAMDAEEFRDRLLRFLLPPGTERRAVAPEEVLRVEQNHAPLFDSWDWVFGAAPDFQVTKRKRLAGGTLEVHLNLARGVIADCRVTGDFFFAGNIGAVTERLKGCRYDEHSVYAAIADVMREQPFYQISAEEFVSCVV